MKIFLVWLAIIACGVANGYFISNFGWPENLVIIFPSMVCIILLLIHRKITKGWEKPLDPWTGGFKFPFFRISLFFSIFIVAMLFVLQEAKTARIVACLTIAIASFIGYRRECKYTDEWI